MVYITTDASINFVHLNIFFLGHESLTSAGLQMNAVRKKRLSTLTQENSAVLPGQTDLQVGLCTQDWNNKPPG